jgi:iron-sulfur cluster-binding protein
MVVSFKLNGKDVKVESPCDARLSNILRDNFSLKSIKIASFDGLRGGDAILLDDNVVPSSLLPIFNVEGREVVTLEYFSTDKSFADIYRLIIKCFKMLDINLCGFCNAGIIFATYKIIKSNFDEEDALFESKIKECYSISLCRCTDMENLILAAKKAISLSLKTKKVFNYVRK